MDGPTFWSPEQGAVTHDESQQERKSTTASCVNSGKPTF